MGNPLGDKDEQRALHRGSFDGSRRMDGVTAGALWVFLPVVPAGFLFGGKLRDVWSNSTVRIGPGYTIYTVRTADTVARASLQVTKRRYIAPTRPICLRSKHTQYSALTCSRIDSEGFRDENQSEADFAGGWGEDLSIGRSRRSKSCNCHEVQSVACAQLRMAHRPCTLGFSGDMSKGSSMVACCSCGNSVIGN